MSKFGQFKIIPTVCSIIIIVTRDDDALPNFFLIFSWTPLVFARIMHDVGGGNFSAQYATILNYTSKKREII